LIGFIVNPIAGMGGKVALKGTDGVVHEAIKRGAEPVSPEIAIKFLRNLRSQPVFLTASGKMGGFYLNEAGFEHRIVYETGKETTAEDTKNAVREMKRSGADIMVFVGGDGTARDVVSMLAHDMPILGIPSGVKMYSSCFAYSPEQAAAMADAFVEGRASFKEAEILDIDEDAYRRGEFSVKLYGTARVPYIEGALQSAKAEYSGGDEESAKEEIAEYIAEEMEPDVLYIIGAGSTTSAIARKIGQEKTLLGIDAYMNGERIAEDLDERSILGLLDTYPNVRLIISPIGAQGFIFGRGNQQISPEVLRRIGKENVIIVSTPGKMAFTPELHVYTGDADTDESFKGYARILTGYGRWKMKKVI